MAKETQLVSVHDTFAENRARIWEKGTLDFRKKVEFMQGMLDQWTRDGVKSHWELGQHFEEIRNDENMGGKKYGLNAVKRISVYFGMDQTVIYNCLKLAQKFTRQEIDEICELRMRNGQLISYTHLLALLIVNDRAKRKELIDRTVAECLTSDQLSKEVSPDLKPNKPLKDGRGRPLAVPRNFDGILAQMESFTDDFLNRAEKVWESDQHSLDAKAVDLVTEDFTEDRAKKLKALADKMHQLSVKAKRLGEEVLQVHKAFLKTLDKKPAPKAIAAS